MREGLARNLRPASHPGSLVRAAFRRFGKFWSFQP